MSEISLPKWSDRNKNTPPTIKVDLSNPTNFTSPINEHVSHKSFHPYFDNSLNYTAGEQSKTPLKNHPLQGLISFLEGRERHLNLPANHDASHVALQGTYQKLPQILIDIKGLERTIATNSSEAAPYFQNTIDQLKTVHRLLTNRCAIAAQALTIITQNGKMATACIATIATISGFIYVGKNAMHAQENEQA